jgi:putative FmdB family regulatory protein
MPNYNYECALCNTRRVVSLPISSDPQEPIKCLACVQNEMYRVLSKPSFIMKESDQKLNQWYKKNTGQDFLG